MRNLPGDELTPARRDELIGWMVERAARAGMLTPALLLVESHRPVSFLGSQAVHFLAPVLGAVVEPQLVDDLARLLEDRDNIDRLVDRLEERLRQEQAARPRAPYPRGWRGLWARLFRSGRSGPGDAAP